MGELGISTVLKRFAEHNELSMEGIGLHLKNKQRLEVKKAGYENIDMSQAQKRIERNI